MLSHHHKTIFIHIPKCAGQSIESAFLNDIGLTWEIRAPLLLRPNDVAALGPPRLAHLTATDYVRCHYIPQSMFDDYFRFAIVRDPWARAVSLYRHLDINTPFREFVLHWLPKQFDPQANGDSYWFVRPQRDFVFDESGNLATEIFRFENLAEEYPIIANACNLGASLPHVNASDGQSKPAPRSWSRRLKNTAQSEKRSRFSDWRDYYDAELIDAIGNIYAVDALAFDYAAPSVQESAR